MNYKNSAQNALKSPFSDSKSKKFSGEGAMPPHQTSPHSEGDTPSPNPKTSVLVYQHACFVPLELLYLHTHNSKFSKKQRFQNAVNSPWKNEQSTVRIAPRMQ